MIYFLTKSIIHLAIKGFFRKIQVIGLENIPPSDPIIFISNHPNALIDPLIISIIIPRKLHFLAGAEFFGKGFKAWLLRKQYNMIPVYRKKEAINEWIVQENDNVNNTLMFSECYKCLQQNGAFLIFPEGSTVSQNKVRNLKTGTARILTSFIKLHPEKRVHIIPIGLNYANPDRFKSDVLVKIGHPVHLEQSLLQLDTPDVIREMTLIFEDSLQQQVFHIEDYTLNPLITHIYQLLRHSRGLETDDAQQTFNTRKKIIEAVTYFGKTAPEKVESVQKHINQYFQKIDELGIKQFFLEEHTIKFSAKRTIQFILFLPLFVLGIVGNLWPYLLTRLIFRIKYRPRLQKEKHDKPINPAFSGTISFAIGTVLFLIWYLGVSLLIGIYTSWWIGLLTLIALYFLGQLSTWYKSLAERVYKKWKTRIKLKRQPQKVQELILLRQEIIKELEKYQHEYELLDD